MIRRPPRFTRTATLFPYTTLFRSIMFRQTAKLAEPAELGVGQAVDHPVRHAPGHRRTDAKPDQPRTHLRFGRGAARERKPEQQGGNKAFDGDRKSTRLNSSH